MDTSNYIELGYISKAHGLRGEVKVIFDVSDLREYRKKKQLYLAKKDQALRICKILKFQIQSEKQAILQFEEVNDRNEAEELAGYTIFMPAEDLPKLPTGHFYYFEVIGFQILDSQRGKLGTIKDIYDGPAHDILVMEYQGKEVLIPLIDEFVGLADFDQQLVYTSLPEGLLETYMS